jgi:hypothetical protein
MPPWVDAESSESEVVELANLDKLSVRLKGNHAVAAVAHVGLDTARGVEDLVAFQALVVDVDLVVQVLDEVLGLCQELALGHEHAVELAHVVDIQVEAGRLVVAEQAVQEGITGRLGGGGDRARFVVGSRLVGVGGRERVLRSDLRRRVVRSRGPARDGRLSVEVCVLDALDYFSELLLDVAAHCNVGLGHGLAERKGGADHGAGD